MKTRELIAQLQDLDPTGDEDVCVGNLPIFFVEALPAYYDGDLQVLEHDPKLAGSYDICGARYRRTGTKLSIRVLSIAEALSENPDLPVHLDDDTVRYHGARVLQWREEGRQSDAAAARLAKPYKR